MPNAGVISENEGELLTFGEQLLTIASRMLADASTTQRALVRLTCVFVVAGWCGAWRWWLLYALAFGVEDSEGVPVVWL
jgi:hypothetical protein